MGFFASRKTSTDVLEPTFEAGTSATADVAGDYTFDASHSRLVNNDVWLILVCRECTDRRSVGSAEQPRMTSKGMLFARFPGSKFTIGAFISIRIHPDKLYRFAQLVRDGQIDIFRSGSGRRSWQHQ